MKTVEEILTSVDDITNPTPQSTEAKVRKHMATARECLDVGATESALRALRSAGEYFEDLAEIVHRDPEAVPAYADIKAAMTELFAAAKEAAKNDPVYIAQSRQDAERNSPWGFIRNQPQPLTMPPALRDPSQ